MTRRKPRRHTFAHNAPEPTSATLTPEYQAEVDRSMERGRLRWEHDQAELAKAERRRERLARQKPKTPRAARLRKRQLAELDEWIELERARLQRLHGLMRQAPQPSVNRGRRSYRPVPDQGEIV